MSNELTPSDLIAAKLKKYAQHFTSLQQTELAMVAQSSEFAANFFPDLVKLIDDKCCEHHLLQNDYKYQLDLMLTDVSLESVVAKILRLFHRKQVLRILFRDITGLSDTKNTLLELSYLANVILLFVMQYSHQQLTVRFGEPVFDNRPQRLVVICMGKLGGNELNFSSDIDLIFGFAQDGNTKGDKSISHHEFFTKQVQLIIKLLTAYSPEGIVYRVDLRLRPFGSSGPVVMNFKGLENYYQEQGRGWERYAMVKARVMAGSADDRANLMAILKPFVYRRYVDFSVIESLRGMKALIAREVKLKKLQFDIKRGRGGIREVEFIVQAYQLTRGGRMPSLQGTGLLAILANMTKEQLMTEEKVKALSQAYLFLRKLENCLQMYQDKQVCVLPEGEKQKRSIAIAMGFPDWQVLTHELIKVQRVVTTAFKEVLKQEDENISEQKILSTQLNSLWQGLLEDEMAEELLASLGFTEVAGCNQLIYDFRHGSKVRRLSQLSRMRLDKCMLLLLEQLPHYDNNHVGLLRVIQLLESIAMRSPYVSLLIENQHVINHLLRLFTQSEWVAKLVAAHPFLLEVLLADTVDFNQISLGDLFSNYAVELTTKNAEQYLDRLGQFKLSFSLMLAVEELDNNLSAIQVAELLSELAQFILKKVCGFCVQQLKEKQPDIDELYAKFAIIAYGTFGSKEMNYESDLDLVFLHQSCSTDEGLMIRLTKKILHTLNTRFSTGVLYAVDTRLRPSGSAGLLVSSVDAFADYQINKAWTWENQALIRARIILGNEQIFNHFNDIKQQVLGKKRDANLLKREIVAMRQKMTSHQKQLDIKHRPGGLIDVEFFIQYLVLLHAGGKKDFSKLTGNVEILTTLKLLICLDDDLISNLIVAIEMYHQRLHQKTLMQVTDNDETIELRCKTVNQIIQYFFGN